MATKPKVPRIGVLIDADNAQAAVIEHVLAEFAAFGTLCIKRAYGDWTSVKLGAWKRFLSEQGIQPFQQFSYTTGKNATDSALIIDAMDLLYLGNLDGFCIVSNDSDFTRLASRLRESGMAVYGAGRKDTARAFVCACDKFIYTETLKGAAVPAAQIPASPSPAPPAAKKNAKAAPAPKAPAVAPAVKKQPATPARKPAFVARVAPEELRQDVKLVHLLEEAVAAAAEEDGWSDLTKVVNALFRLCPDFQSKTYGYAKLGRLIADLDLFEFIERKGKRDAKRKYLRPRPGLRIEDCEGQEWIDQEERDRVDQQVDEWAGNYDDDRHPYCEMPWEQPAKAAGKPKAPRILRLF